MGGRTVLAGAPASSAVAARPLDAATRIPPTGSLVRDVLVLVAERALEVLHADVAAVGLVDGAGTAITVDVVAGDQAAELCGTTIPAGSWQLDQVLSRGRPVVVADLCASSLHPPLVELACVGPCLAVPLWGRLQPYGVLIAGRHRGAPPFPSEAVTDLQGVRPGVWRN